MLDGAVGADGGALEVGARDAFEPDGGAGVDGGAPLDSGLGDAASPDSGPPPTGTSPRLHGFRVEAASPECVTFDSSAPIASTDVTGFIVSGETIDALRVNDGLVGHCFVVTEPFTYWDNHTIRYEGGSDIGVREFDLQNIVNLIPEPAAGVDRYVSADARGGGDGTVGDEWTLEEAGLRASAGETVNVRAGNYGAANLVIANSGTQTSPIRFVGYRSEPGDGPELGWSYPDNAAFDAAMMPLLDGGDEFEGRGIETQGSYIIVENFQVQAYQTLFLIQRPASFVEIRNVSLNRGLYGFQQTQSEGRNVRVLDSLVYQTRTTGIRIYGNHNRIERNRVYDDRVNGDPVDGVDPSYSMDYYLNLNGLNNIVRDCYLERIEQPECFDIGGGCDHSGHGLSMKANGGPTTEYNLAENVEVVGISLSIEVWHPDVAFNVFRNIRAWRRATTSQRKAAGIDVLRGAHDNIFDNISVTDGRWGIMFQGTGNENNLVRNSVFQDNLSAIRIDDPSSGNRFVGCVFHNNGTFVIGDGASASSDQIINSQVSATMQSGNLSGFDFQYSNFWDSFATPGGTGNLSVDPGYADVESGDFHLTASSPMSVREGGVTEMSCRYGRGGNERTEPYSIGAYELDL